MGNTGIVWSDWAAVQKSGGGDWTGLDVADNGNAGSAAIAFGTKVAIKVGYSFVEDNTGAIDGDVTIWILMRRPMVIGSFMMLLFLLHIDLE